MFEKVLILSASVGAGHVSAANAIEKELKDQKAAKTIKNIEKLTYKLSKEDLLTSLTGDKKASLHIVNSLNEIEKILKQISDMEELSLYFFTSILYPISFLNKAISLSISSGSEIS